MVLIADSGSSKTDWQLLRKGYPSVAFHSKGLNPVLLTSEEIRLELLQTFSDANLNETISEIHFFGSGCWNEATCFTIERELALLFPHAKIKVASDMLGAVIATCDGRAGITCILGTGTNCCWYDGQQIIDAIPSLGYILGNEGSGAFLGKQLIRHYFYRELPEDLQIAFTKEYSLDKAALINRVYKSSANDASRYLASFALFLKKNLGHPFVIKLIKNSFGDFLKKQVVKYPVSSSVPIHFVGSIAYHFKPILLECLQKQKLQIGNILEKPIYGLEKYFQSLILNKSNANNK